MKYNNDDYDLWYYKMYFRTLDPIIRQENEYHILVDIKDTKGGKRIQKLKEVMCNNIYDFNGEVISHIGQINSMESEILQLVDLLNGALAYHYRKLENGENANKGKSEFVKELQKSKILIYQRLVMNQSLICLFGNRETRGEAGGKEISSHCH